MTKLARENAMGIQEISYGQLYIGSTYSLGQVCTPQLRHKRPVYPWIYVVQRGQNNAHLGEKHTLM